MPITGGGVTDFSTDFGLAIGRVLDDLDRYVRQETAAGRTCTYRRSRRSLAELQAYIGDCQRCPILVENRNKIVFGAGNPNAELVFAGEAPGADEDVQGEPFVGRAGQLLTKIIQAMGLERRDVYILNVIKCRPPGNRDPQPDEVANCSPFMLEQIEIIRPKIIVALGRHAAQTLLDTTAPMGKLRGQWFDWHGIALMPTFHPAYLLRNPAGKREVWDDMKAVLRRLGRPVPRRG
ncbi:MAG: uracil-DNA glycosylase [Verrucomicrobia bacterium]|nr:uracil-DNA glycosylase [Verrucomicrobiota bacterium]